MSNNLYQMVTDRIIAELEKGLIPWQKPWTGSKTGAYNLITKKRYSLLNQMLLGKSGAWASFSQVKEKGGKVKKGEKSSICVFWKMVKVEEENDKGKKVEKLVPFLRYYNVFHIATQTEGIEIPEDEEISNDIEPIEEADNILMNYIKREGITLEQEISDEAWYSPLQDKIHLPKLEQFAEVAEYYSTAFHEASHSTGHKDRLNRPDLVDMNGFGSTSYSREELTSEIASSLILNLLGIETPQSFKNNTAYIQSWLKVLKNDNRFIISASSRAEKAVDFILGA